MILKILLQRKECVLVSWSFVKFKIKLKVKPIHIEYWGQSNYPFITAKLGYMKWPFSSKWFNNKWVINSIADYVWVKCQNIENRI